MKNLLVYTTKHGCTEKCAQKLQAQLTGETTVVNLKEQQPPNLDDFDSVILGGSIYASSTQKPLKQFAVHHLDDLLKKKVFLFLCSGFQKAEDFQTNFPEQLTQHAIMKSLFGGEMVMEKLGFFERLIAKLAGGKGGGTPLHINEEEIAAFAKAVNSA